MRIIAYSTDDDCLPHMRWLAYCDSGGDYAPVRHFGETREVAVSRANEFYADAMRRNKERQARVETLRASRKKTKAVA